MFPTLRKRLVWAIVIWFAILQTLSPLIHAHVETDTPDQGYGVHIHVQEIVQKVPSFENFTKSLHTIGIDQALIKKVDLLPSMLLPVLFILFSLLVLRKHYTSALTFLRPLPSYLRPQSRPRAPPHF